MAPSIDLYTPGLLDYTTAWRWQQHTAKAVRNGSPEALVLLQHPPVSTTSGAGSGPSTSSYRPIPDFRVEVEPLRPGL